MFSSKLLEDLRSVENSFADLHRRYEKLRASGEDYKKVPLLFRPYCSLKICLEKNIQIVERRAIEAEYSGLSSEVETYRGEIPQVTGTRRGETGKVS